jgi:hypothetical protein
MKGIKKIMAIIFAVVCVIGLLPTMKTEAAIVTVNGGCTTRATAYSWGAYSTTNTITVVLPESEDDFWVAFTLPKDKRVYARCSYSNDNEGMYIEMRNSSNRLLDEKYSSDDVLDMDTVIPFMAVACDNLTSSTQTFYIHVNRGTCEGTMYFSLSMNERIKTGSGTFTFSGTATNPGNSSISLSGVDSSILSLNLTNNTTIPPEAIVTSVSTSGTQSPSQGNVHHMILPATESSVWYTSTVSSATSGSYTIDSSDGFAARQVWQFKYNALATAKSTMKSVKLTLKWEYDIANTGYKTY